MPLPQQAYVLAQGPRVRRLHQLIRERPGARGPGEQVVEHLRRGGGVRTVEVRLAHVGRQVRRYSVLPVLDQVHLVKQGLLPCR